MTQLRSLAVAQTAPVAGDFPANLQNHMEMTELAAEGGARVVVFPELSLTGYELGEAHRLALTEDDPRLGPLTEVASASDTILVVGAPAKIGASLHIGAFILRPDGIVQVYTKHRLGAFQSSANPAGPVPPAEATVFTPGDRSPMLKLGDQTAAVAICADLGNPSHPERAAKGGATTYLASTFVVPSDIEEETARLQSYAERHGMAVAFSNFGGPSGGLPSAGKSSIWADTGELIVQLDGSGPGLAFAFESPGGWTGRTVMLDRPRPA